MLDYFYPQRKLVSNYSSAKKFIFFAIKLSWNFLFISSSVDKRITWWLAFGKYFSTKLSLCFESNRPNGVSIIVGDNFITIAAPININRRIHRINPDDRQNTPGGQRDGILPGVTG